MPVCRLRVGCKDIFREVSSTPCTSRVLTERADPSSGDVIAEVPEFDAEDVGGAVEAAALALDKFRATSHRERATLLRIWHDLVIDNAEDIAQLLTLESGKPLADARAETASAAAFMEWFSEEATRSYGYTIPNATAGERVITIKEPIGVCGLITPWNYPAAMITRKAAPAIAAGCSVVLKSPGETPLAALALAELGHRAGIPKGIVNVFSALENTAEVGRFITTHPNIKKVSFTGSTPVGKLLMKQASSTLKKLSFELGGNAAFIIFDDADLDVAVSGAVTSKFRSAGQTCVCANRIFVHEDVYDEFARRFVDKVRAFQVGDGSAAGVTLGTLIHGRAVDKVESHVADAKAKGSEAILGGNRIPELGPNFFQPTVITGMTHDMAMASEETFGPVAGLYKFRTEKEVVTLANSVDVGLAAYVFSRDIQRVGRVSEALQMGMVGVNTGLVSDVAAPFGGVKESGFGREGSTYGLDEYTVTKMVRYGGMSQPLQC